MAKITVVLADANEEFTSMLKEDIERSGDFTVVGIANDGMEAIKLIESEQPQLLITEVLLPGLDGLGILDHIQRTGEKTKTIFVSKAYHDHIVVKALEKGAVYFMPKPCNTGSLLERMRQAIEPPTVAVSVKTLAMKRKAAMILHDIGMPANLKGYKYVLDAIILTVQMPGLISAVTKELYPEVAQRHNTTASRVERAIRHAIEVTWDHIDGEALQRYFGNTVSSDRGKPTNSEFVAMIAEIIRLEGEETA